MEQQQQQNCYYKYRYISNDDIVIMQEVKY